ncbi:MAG: GNAT family N-acetyltransferase [Candidatus Nanopelagicales bacterium]
MPLPDGFAIAPMTAPEVDVLVDWAAAEAWNPGVHDVAIAWREQPEAFWALRRGDELVGGASVMAYGGAWGFLGLFIVREDLRSHGLGGELWDHLLVDLRSRLRDDAPIGLDGVVAMQPFYRRSGFVDAYRDIRFSGRPVCEPDPFVTVIEGEQLTPAGERELVAFDEALAIGPRRSFMRHWFTAPGVLVATLRHTSGLGAIGAMRPCREGWKLGPVLASVPDDAARVVRSLVAAAHGSPVALDVPEPNAAAVAIARDLALEQSFECARMYLGPQPAIAVDHVFGVTSFELG